MHLLSSVLFALSANIDTLILGLTYGMKKCRIPLLVNTLISLITFIGTMGSIYAGRQLVHFIPAKAALLFGSAILILLGLYYIAKFFIKMAQGKSQIELHCTEEKEVKKITVKEAIVIACALSVNNMGMGIGASIAGMSALPTSLSTLCFCMIFLYTGNKIGNISVSNLMQAYAEPLSGLILILLGTYELLL